jgi:hypothetical protein
MRSPEPTSPCWPRAAADPPCRAGAHLRDDDLFHPVLPAPSSSSSPRLATELRAPARDPARRGAPSRGRAPAASPAWAPSQRGPFVRRVASAAAGEATELRAPARHADELWQRPRRGPLRPPPRARTTAGESRRARAASVPTASSTCDHLPQHEIRPPSPPLAGGAALAAWPCGPPERQLRPPSSAPIRVELVSVLRPRGAALAGPGSGRPLPSWFWA